ncbi:MAG: hypothetical protein CR986_02765 [Ignavibacteriae bacterium]|nr:MAG: hypothetical protein CR986_02765 [Ignavibacteriota bacterium]
MSNFKKILTVIFAITLFTNFLSAQDEKITNLNRVDNNIIILNLHNASFAYNNSRFSLTYNLPGLQNVLGELNFDYKTENKDSYYLNLALSYIMVGVHKVILNLEKSTYYLNGGVGIFSNGGLIGITGGSYIKELTPKSNIEIAINGMYHEGIGYDEDLPVGLSLAAFQTRAIGVTLIYSLNLFRKLTLSISTGYTYSAYKYAKTKHQYFQNMYEYRFASKKELEENGYIGEAKWKAFGAIPLGIAFSWHF